MSFGIWKKIKKAPPIVKKSNNVTTVNVASALFLIEIENVEEMWGDKLVVNKARYKFSIHEESVYKRQLQSAWFQRRAAYAFYSALMNQINAIIYYTEIRRATYA